MKATGIVRRIDDLGRVVIPKEIRRTMRIREGDPLEIYTDADGEVIFKKYSPIGELSSITGQYADVLYRGTGLAVIVTDRDCVIACAGISKRGHQNRRVSQSLETVMEKRENYVCAADSTCLNPSRAFTLRRCCGVFDNRRRRCLRLAGYCSCMRTAPAPPRPRPKLCPDSGLLSASRWKYHNTAVIGCGISILFSSPPAYKYRKT